MNMRKNSTLIEVCAMYFHHQHPLFDIFLNRQGSAIATSHGSTDSYCRHVTRYKNTLRTEQKLSRSIYLQTLTPILLVVKHVL